MVCRGDRRSNRPFQGCPCFPQARPRHEATRTPGGLPFCGGGGRRCSCKTCGCRVRRADRNLRLRCLLVVRAATAGARAHRCRASNEPGKLRAASDRTSCRLGAGSGRSRALFRPDDRFGGGRLPSRSALAPDPAGQAALKYLRDRGEVVELSPEIYLSRFIYARLRKAVTRYLGTHGSATASQLRQDLGTTRRVLIPLLEKLDRDGVTRRDGDHRKLRSS
jgi:hypothetical protein